MVSDWVFYLYIKGKLPNLKETKKYKKRNNKFVDLIHKLK